MERRQANKDGSTVTRRNLPAEERRRELPEAAIDLFSEKGMSITVQALADRVKVTQPLGSTRLRFSSARWNSSGAMHSSVIFVGIRRYVYHTPVSDDLPMIVRDQMRAYLAVAPQVLSELMPQVASKAG